MSLNTIVFWIIQSVFHTVLNYLFLISHLSGGFVHLYYQHFFCTSVTHADFSEYRNKAFSDSIFCRRGTAAEPTLHSTNIIIYFLRGSGHTIFHSPFCAVANIFARNRRNRNRCPGAVDRPFVRLDCANGALFALTKARGVYPGYSFVRK